MSSPAALQKAQEVCSQQRAVSCSLVMRTILYYISEASRQKGKTQWIEERLWNILDPAERLQITNHATNKKVELKIGELHMEAM